MSQQLAIGDVAAATGTSISAIRYYEQRGLVAPAGRAGDKRRFEPAAVQRVDFIRRAKTAGFSLDQIRTLLDDTTGSWTDTVAERVAELNETRRELDRTIAALEAVQACGCEVVATCPRAEEFSPCVES